MKPSAHTGLLVVAILSVGCASVHPYIASRQSDWQDANPPPAVQQTYRVFLIGDAGDGATDALALLGSQLRKADTSSAVVFLGDNVYPKGVPDSSASDWHTASRRLRDQLQVVQGFAGRVVFIPGNHDWANGGSDGLSAVKRQEAYVEAALGRGNTFLPDDGFPGPVEIELSKDLTLVVLDTQWWLHRHEKSFGDAGGYNLSEAGDVLLELEDVMLKHRNENLLVVGHHPMFSNGRHGGHFPATSHLKPAPAFGSLSLLHRRFIGKQQDLAHPRYASMRKELTGRFAEHEDLIYVAGHDHSLQYFTTRSRHASQHYIVSGAGSRPEYAAPRKGAVFAAGRQPGFVTLQYYADRSVWMEAWAAATGASENSDGVLLFRQQLKAPSVEPEIPQPTLAVSPDYRDSVEVRGANPTYARKGPVTRLLLGEHHRAAWAMPVAFPVLDLEREKGGLTPVKMGGVGQSITLRMRGGDGHEYVLRSIDKFAGRAWPSELRATFARRLAQDQFSMLHPYAAFLAAPLAEATGVYHSAPRYVVVPDHPRLGLYRERMAGQVFLFEERPDDDMLHLESVGNSRKVVGYSRLFQEINNDNDHRVDARAWARARLLDLLIADRDRHVDQWRWASFEPYELDSTLSGAARTEGKIYRPIPRDRDVAFIRFDGLLAALVAFTSLNSYQDFQDDYGDLKVLINNGLAQDRRFTASLSEADWLAEAVQIQTALTDAVLQDAIRHWPEPIVELDGAEFLRKLKARRDALPAVATDVYRLLAREVDVVGSNKHELFAVNRLPDGRSEVVVYKTNADGDIRRELFRRTFDPLETREIRLYGQGGNDQFTVTGEADSAIRLRAIGGVGEDRLTDSSTIFGSRKSVHYYDTINGTTTTSRGESRIHQSADPGVNDYDPDAHSFNTSRPVGFFGYNRDDGIFLGGGAIWARERFRKDPFGEQHRLVANTAAYSRAFNVQYHGRFTDMLGQWDFAIDARVLSPNSIHNYYGLGNETTPTITDAAYYQTRFSRVLLKPSFVRTSPRGIELSLGPTFEFTDVRLDPDRFVAQPQAGISTTSFEDQWFGGLAGSVLLESTDGSANPHRGIRWKSTVDVHFGLYNSSATYGTAGSDLTFYLSPSFSPRIAFAGRIGGAHTVGDFPFYNANTLGNSNNLRGFRNTRFAGRSIFFQNIDVRVELFPFANYFGYGTVGVLGFFDNGRVWTDDETSTLWHRGYGGGLWVALLHQFVLSGTYGISMENRGVTVRSGFQF